MGGRPTTHYTRIVYNHGRRITKGGADGVTEPPTDTVVEPPTDTVVEPPADDGEIVNHQLMTQEDNSRNRPRGGLNPLFL